MMDNNYFWQGEKIRLRPMRPEDTAVWLAEEDDSQAVRFLNYGMVLPKSEKDAAAFSERYADRLGCQEEGHIRRSIYTNGRYYDELIFGLTREKFDKLLSQCVEEE